MQVMDFSPANCKNCYKCVRTCSVKAIEVKNHQARIIEERCIACGHCFVVCPQNARNVLSDLEHIKSAIKNGNNVIAQVAPAFRGFFENSPKIVTALKKIGFQIVEEVSIGAELVSQSYEKIIRESDKSEFLTSCCPSVIMLIEQYYPELISNILPVVSPMIAHGKIIKSNYPNSFVVFIGPCISKKYEALLDENKGIVDAVLTFDELIQWISEENIDINNLEESTVDNYGSKRGSSYPLAGGILNAIRSTALSKNIDLIKVDGIENCKSLLEALKNKDLENVCVELSICNESCLGGPGGTAQGGTPFKRIQNLHKYIMRRAKETKEEIDYVKPYIDLSRTFKDRSIKSYMPTEEEIKEILSKMGKYEKEDELNCGACGYDSCYKKAIAVSQNMSQIDMCLPYMRSIAERMSNEIFQNSPNAILLLDKFLNIVEINPIAKKIFGVEKEELKGEPISTIMDDTTFKRVIEDKKSIPKQKVNYLEYNYHAYRSIIYMEKQSALLVIFTDITEEENRKLELNKIKENTLDVTQTIIDKQMRVAQEIASLLGETTAETKVALMKLKKVLKEEKEV
ncbi:MAG: PAS domain S-box protein [Clostridium argentinense]|uniref:[Fe-Fe] hydrogenase large subunit C-terminal domain-containing protein n=1 Tax=Clostridium butanoliproducens TaxID=2991837 RepID=UPI001DA0E7F4|nr:[Fe-Fe] hydrogenase large subunit C-terminal domain-containing protein [Clostridium butanoliproducens]MBS5824569.1 PAS domain S-box protein [Clostridium argentinense]